MPSGQGRKSYRSFHLLLPTLWGLIVLLSVVVEPGKTLSAQAPVGGSAPSDFSVVVRLTPEEFGKVADLDSIRAIHYGAFVWLELTPEGLSNLIAKGVEFEHRGVPSSLEIQGRTIDTRDGGSSGITAPGRDGRSFHLVQLLGPAKQAWQDDLVAAGVEVVQFIGDHTYLVRGHPADLAAAATLDSVRWSGSYLPEYRISTELVGRTGLIQNVSVTLYDDKSRGGTVERAIRAIERLGGVLVEQSPPGSTDPFATASFLLPADILPAVAELGEVAWLSFRAPFYPDEDEMSSQIIAGNFNPLNPGYAAWQTMVGVNGTGVTIAALDRGYDTGVDGTAHPDLSGRTIMVSDSDGIPTDQNGHGTHVGGIIAANASLGTLDASGFLMGLGVAPQATLVVRRRTVDSDSTQTQDAVVNGAVASNHSYALHDAGIGYTDRDRTYDILVRDADQSTANVAEPLIIVFSAGNSGGSGPTKEPKNVITVGSTFNQRDGMGNPGFNNINNVTGTSSQGPAGDGRVFPVVCAPGGNVISTRYSAAASCANIPVGGPAMDPTYSMCSGTSMAAPHVTGSVALIIQWWRTFNGGSNPSPAMAKALLVNGAVDIGAADIPNGSEGWGRVNLANVINTGIPTLYFDQTNVFTDTGQAFAVTFSADDPTQPVRISLAWADAPGPGGGGNPMTLVNDLDLVVDDSGTVYLGNDFAAGLSTTGGFADTVDNLENVFLTGAGESNFFTVTVNAAGINGNGVPYNGDGTDQDFALVCFNAVANASPPDARCQDVTVPADGECMALASIDDGSFDPDDDPITLMQDPPGPYPLGETVVTLTATDDKGASDSCQATVTVVDETPPDIECPADVTITCGESLDPADTGMAMATDNCDPDPVITFEDIVVPTDCPADPIQEFVLRTWTATDFSGNDSSCVQTITVMKLVLELDIKPGSCPNPLNRKAGGGMSSGAALPVGLLGTSDFDVTQVVLSSVVISRADCVGMTSAPTEGPSGPHSVLADVGTPFGGDPCDCHSLTGDGIIDWALKFNRADVVEKLQLEGLAQGSEVQLVVSGTLADGCEFIATDCVKLVR